MNHEAIVKMLELAQEANRAGDQVRVARCLDVLIDAHRAPGAWQSAWDAVARDTQVATANATIAADIERGRG